MNDIFNFANEVIEKANKVILKNQFRVRKISYKKDFSNLVTNVDREVENLIINEITSKYPNHSIIAEESGNKRKDPTYEWFIDPIDGTTNFAHGYPCYCISIGFSSGKVLQFGLVKNPANGDLYSAIKNKGAKLNNKKIHASKIKTLKESLLVTGFPYERKNLKNSNFKNFQNITLLTQGVRRDGAAALDLCYVAQGVLDGFWELNLSPWDVAGGVLIVQEAGGKVTDFKGNKFDVYKKGIVVSNGLIHKELLNHLTP